ncbi:TIGR03619 family F420-dependent LLM class oxidoreductase [Candidatus Nephthysia bennettiae]|uniref:TIGR03619 family F420-dependent LLM class oxidoreductase n=1 Tax=Candidatus Nephthysia bennettiae TaxID=3127016 RepID=A0A934NEG6_9BACT|nr:TIGR03619 family F420-dependent LLM class oxidoreductase [Candidatus Dormibacteraeota bacterium]MBJ7614060.1 TIGR03619 family F420-dependent LLM class oxidoreductase [Candidatus Dormibacteraeota bacterium]
MSASGRGRKLELSIVLPTFSQDPHANWDSVLGLARMADEAGVDRLVVPDHVVFGERLEEYGRPEVGGRRGGKQPTGPDGSWLEPLTTLSVLAGITKHIRLGTSVLLAALRRPVVLAKAVATLDVLSGGRVDLGVGVGWQREEYEAAGLDFARRGRLLDHALEVCQALWLQPRAAYDSSELRFEAIHMMPKPVQHGGVPIWVSGTVTAPVARRLVRFGSGWIPWGLAADDLITAIGSMKELIAAGGGDPSKLKVVGALPVVHEPGGQLRVDRMMEAVQRLAEAGVTDFRIRASLTDDQSAALKRLAGIVTAFRASTHESL